MTDFIRALLDPHMPFFRYAVLGGILASVAFGIMGSYVVVRKISSIAGAIAHCVLGGIGAALYCQNRLGWAWCDPMYGAIAAALLAAVLLGLVSIYARQREDTVIGALWAIGMAIGILFIARTPGYVDAMSYLFGNILLVTRRDLALIVGLDVLVVVVALLFYHQFLAVCFDDRFARLQGVRVQLYYLLLLALTALTIVLLLPVVGIVMVIALLTLPAAVAGHFSKRLWSMMGLAVVFSMVFIVGGIGVSYRMDLPAGPVIIILAGATYLGATLFRVFKSRQSA
jgi:zinc transport system permease protein